MCREPDLEDVSQQAARQSRVLDMAGAIAHDVGRPGCSAHHRARLAAGRTTAIQKPRPTSLPSGCACSRVVPKRTNHGRSGPFAPPPLQPTVGLGDPSEGAALVTGQVWGILQQRPPAALQRRCLIMSSGAQPVDHLAAERVEGLGGPDHDVEASRQSTARGAYCDHVVDPLRAISRDVGQCRSSFGPRSKNRPSVCWFAVLAGPHQPAVRPHLIMVRHLQERQ